MTLFKWRQLITSLQFQVSAFKGDFFIVTQQRIKQSIYTIKFWYSQISFLSLDGLHHDILDPNMTSPRQFVEQVEKYSLAHKALSHKLLNDLGTASYGPAKTAEVALLYLTAYSHFTAAFAGHVSDLVDKLEEPKHREVLEENLEEEMGSYDEKTLSEINEIAGEDIASQVDGVAHKQLYHDMLSHLEKRTGKSFKNQTEMLEKISAPLIQAKKEMGESVDTLIGTLYFGSELIVPKLYSVFVKSLRLSMDYSNKELIFFLLHVDMDAEHADEMKEIVVDHCESYESRLNILTATEKFMNGRIKFYEAVMANCS